MNKYRLFLTSSSSKDLKKLDKNILGQIENKLKRISDNPEKEGKMLSHLPKRWKNLRSARSGKYRILYTIEGKDIVIHAVKHRSMVYDILL